MDDKARALTDADVEKMRARFEEHGRIVSNLNQPDDNDFGRAAIALAQLRRERDEARAQARPMPPNIAGDSCCSVVCARDYLRRWQVETARERDEARSKENKAARRWFFCDEHVERGAFGGMPCALCAAKALRSALQEYRDAVDEHTPFPDRQHAVSDVADAALAESKWLDGEAGE